MRNYHATSPSIMLIQYAFFRRRGVPSPRLRRDGSGYTLQAPANAGGFPLLSLTRFAGLPKEGHAEGSIFAALRTRSPPYKGDTGGCISQNTFLPTFAIWQ